MAVQVFTVAQYRAYIDLGVSLPEGDTIQIVDNAGAIERLTKDDIEGLDDNRVTLLNATDNALAFYLDQFQALGTVGFSAEDKLTLRDSQNELQNSLNPSVVQALSQKGFSAIDVDSTGNFVAISVETARALLATNLAFDDSDNVAVQDITGALNSSFFSFFSAPEIMALGSKGINSISFNSNEDFFPVRLGAVQAKALADSGISLGANAFRILADDGADLARLSPAVLAKLATRIPFALDALDNVLTLSFDQYRALEITNPVPDPFPGWPDAVVFDPNDEVTLELRAADLTGLADAELVRMARRGIDVLSVKETGSALSSLTVQQIEALKSKGADVLDASDNVLSLTYAQYKATNGMTFAASDVVTVSLSAAEVRTLTNAQAAEAKAKGVDNLILKDGEQALAALTAAEIAALASKGVSVIDATDNKIALSLAQYNALGSTKLTGSDTISVLDSGSNLSGLSEAQVAALSLAGIDELDASNNSYTLSSAQYNALGSIKLSPGDRVTILAESDVILSNGGNDLTLIGNAIRGTGNSLANTISGNAASNVLDGFEGNDLLSGGLGNDQLSGGSGSDVFVFDKRTNKSTNVDTIFDFKSKDDSIYLDDAIFTKLGRGNAAGVKFKSDMFVESNKAKDREDRIVYDKKTGSLYYDQDGTGSKAQVKIATLSNKEKLFFNDFFVI